MADKNCNIIFRGEKYSDEDFKKYLRDNGITEDQLIREKDLMDRAGKLSYQVKGMYKSLIQENPWEVLKNAAYQANSSKGEKRGAVATFGKEIVDIAQELFPNESPYLQVDSSIPKPASPKTIAKIKEFNDRIGVKQANLEALIVNGKKLNANGLALPYKGLLLIVDGKEDVALPEESMHMAVEIVQQTNPTLFNALLSDVNKYPELQQVMTNYSKNKLYQTPDGKPDIIKLKKEASAKVLAKIVGDHIDETDNKANIGQTRALWQRIKDWLKKLFSKAGFDPFQEVAEQVSGEKEFKGSVNDLKENKQSYLQKNKEAVDYQFSGLKKLSDNIEKVKKWETQIKDPDMLFKKIQQDLQMPKDQLTLLRAGYDGNIVEAMTSMATDMSYTVTVKRSMAKEKTSLAPDPTQFYSRLTVPGGINYEENEIATPQIVPSIAGHARFATDNGIGWFRSDEKATTIKEENSYNPNYSPNMNLGGMTDDEIGDYVNRGLDKVENKPFITTYNGSKTRRILEIQSDLFQRGRDKSRINRDNISNDRLLSRDVIDPSTPDFEYNGSIYSFTQDVDVDHEGPYAIYVATRNGHEITNEEYQLAHNTKFGSKSRIEEGSNQHSTAVQESNNQNNFLQLLNKDGNWVGVFVKSIMQDSLNKGYEKVRFPAGGTAAKVEGHQAIADRIIKIDQEISKAKGETITEHNGSKGIYYKIGEDGETYLSKAVATKNLSERIVDLEQERHAYKTQGIEKLAPIEGFYEVRVKNTLDKAYGKNNITRVTDEHGNDWFEVAVDQTRDSEIYLQLNQDDTFNHIDRISNTLAKSGSEYTVNGEKVDRSVDKSVDNYLEYKFKTPNEYLNAREAFRNESEDKVSNEIENIAKRYIDDAGLIRDDYNTSPITSIIDPYDTSFVETLSPWIREKIESYPDGTKFLINKNLYDPKKNMAGRADFIAIQPDGKVDINQYKLLTVGKKAKDISQNLQGAYNIEIQGLRDILQNAYGVTKGDFGETRAIPIKAIYEKNNEDKFELSGVKVANKDLDLEKDQTLLPVPSLSESTGNSTLDSMIRTFRATADLMSRQKAPIGQENIKLNRVAELYAAIRDLQVRKNALSLITAGKRVVDYENNKFSILDKKIREADPLISREVGLNELQRNLAFSRNRLAPFRELSDSIRLIYGRDSEFTKKATEVSNNANTLTSDYNRLEDYLRTDKLSKVTNINDALSPEKSINWYNKYIRSLGQQTNKSLVQLFRLVERKANLYHRRSEGKYQELVKLGEGLEKAGISSTQLQKLFLEYDDKGRWTGNTIRKVNPEFYKSVNEALKKGDSKKLRSITDDVAYVKWYNDRLASVIEEADLENWGDTEEESDRLRKEHIQKFKEVHDIRSADIRNKVIFAFPKEGMWESKEYQELKKYPAALALYDKWNEMEDHSAEIGMLEERAQKNGFFPNVRKPWLQTLSDGSYKKGLLSPWSAFEVLPDDAIFGSYDPVTNKPINQVKAAFLADLGRTVTDTDGSYYKDYDLKSNDILKVMALWVRETMLYELRTETDALANMLYDTESRKLALKSYKKGPDGELQVVENITNVDAMRQFIESEWYNIHKEGGEGSIEVNIGGPVRALNNFFAWTGITMFREPKNGIINISPIKFLVQTTRFVQTAVLGAKLLPPFSNLFGGSVNLFMSTGTELYNKVDILRAYTLLTSSYAWKSPEARKRAGFLAFIQPDLGTHHADSKIRHMSTSKAVKYLSSDYLFMGFTKSDEFVSNTLALAVLDNTLYMDGELLNISDYVKAKNNYGTRYSLDPAERIALEKKVANEIDDLKHNSPDLFIKHITLGKDGEAIFPKISDDEYIRYRQVILSIRKDILGNTSPEDLSLYHRGGVFSMAMAYKSWISRMLDVRMASLKFSPETNKYREGRTRTLGSAISHYGLSAASNILKSLTGNKEDLINMFKKDYQRNRQKFGYRDQEFNMSEGDFIDMKLRNTMTSLKEVALALGVLGMWFLVKSWQKDVSPENRGYFKYSLRAIDRLQDEISFFFVPTSFTSLVSGNVFPPLSLATDATKIFRNAIAWSYYEATDQQQMADKQHISKYIYKDFPITSEWQNFKAIYDAQWAKENGIILQTQSGGH